MIWYDLGPFSIPLQAKLAWYDLGPFRHPPRVKTVIQVFTSRVPELALWFILMKMLMVITSVPTRKVLNANLLSRQLISMITIQPRSSVMLVKVQSWSLSIEVSSQKIIRNSTTNFSYESTNNKFVSGRSYQYNSGLWEGLGRKLYAEDRELQLGNNNSELFLDYQWSR